ncbi:MAG: hypothetical protein OXE05_09565 [Chloroflexi bacterium]|nr:hypothetical protein [Chloroflexota bacterium]
METSTTVKRIVCLANSRKEGDRCIAGKELLADGSPGPWVRPVSDREDEAVDERERQYAGGSEPRVLDVIDVPVREPRPKGYQQENWLLDPNRRWRKAERIGPDALKGLAEPAGPLWINGYHTHHGRNDRLPLERAVSVKSSLQLIKVGKLVLDVFAPRIEQGDFKRRIKGQFRYAGEEYRLWVTDPVYEQIYLNRPNARYQIGQCFLTVSLGEPYQGYAYKLIAAIIEL